MFNDTILISIDPGEYGALTVFKNGIRVDTIDYDINKYREIFEKFDNFVVAIETIDPFPGRILPFGVLKENKGKILGQLETLNKTYTLIEEGLKPGQWKQPWKDELIKPKGTIWPEYEEKIRAINKCKELYPDIDIPLVRTVNHKDGTKTDYYKDGRADSCLIGHYVLNYYEEYLEKQRKKLEKEKKKKLKKVKKS